jgi:hypothetical protein
MTPFRHIEANRRNTKAPVLLLKCKQHSRCNAPRHGLATFEAGIIADYDVQSAVERELLLRLASLLWKRACSKFRLSTEGN